jgi:hypothetical protein
VNLADVNVVLAAYLADHVQHQRCATWLSKEVNAGSRFAVSPQVLSSVIRIATNPKAQKSPASTRHAVGFANTLLSAATAVVVQPGPGHWQIFEKLLKETSATGNLIPDAWFAALAIEHGCTWVTLDRDYARFKDLRTAAP